MIVKLWGLIAVLTVIAAALCYCQSQTPSVSAAKTENLKPCPVSKASPAVIQSATDPFILIHKAERRLELRSGQTVLRTCRIALGNSPVGTKFHEGDGRTPEGRFYICTRNRNSKYYRSLGLPIRQFFPVFKAWRPFHWIRHVLPDKIK